jgi:hypothetical protein
VARFGFGSQYGPDLRKEGIGSLVLVESVGLALARKELGQALLLLTSFGGGHLRTSR